MKLAIVILSVLPLSCAGSSELDSLLLPVAELRAASGQPSVAPVASEAVPAAMPVAPARPPEAVYASTADVLGALSEALTQKFQPDGTLRIEAAMPWKSAKVRDAAWRVELIRVPPQGLAPRMIVSFRILCGEESQGDFAIQLSCTVMRDVYVSARRIERGEAVSAGDFSIQQRDVLSASVKAVSAATALSEYRTRTIVGDGQVLQWRDVELKPLIRKGQMVEAVASEGTMRISIKAIALEDGREGDVVSVRNLSSNKDIQARILNERTVQVYF